MRAGKKVGPGVKASDLGATKRGSGKQATYNGMPLYRFIATSRRARLPVRASTILAAIGT
jgi:hypothetical protein